mmetsp:Transcript_24441/g.37902  ORF Transcript_24441/g.37902 Transcript_24441/m.37902 type:complete len:91 (+) Transcript_24441:504-776(+)
MKSTVRHKAKLERLEAVYFNRIDAEVSSSSSEEQDDDEETKREKADRKVDRDKKRAAKPVLIFDTINNHFAENASLCRQQEKKLQAQMDD